MAACNCPRCAENAAKKLVKGKNGQFYRRCDECHKPIPRYENMGGAGFEGHGTDHVFKSMDLGKPVDQPVHLELCYPCFKKDFEKAYPGQKAPVIANVEAIAPLE